MSTQQTSSKWYQKKWLLILLLFIIPPVGIIGVFLRDTKIWKRIVYTLLGVFMSFYLLAVLLLLVTPNVGYLDGNRLYEQGKYSEAISEFRKVNKDDENYTNAFNKIESAKSKIDSIAKIEKQILLNTQKDSLAQTEKKKQQIVLLKSFQKQWADSILKSESKPGNRHFVNVKYNLPDTILFEYTKGITKNGFDNNFNIDKDVYSNHYKKSLSQKLGKEFLTLATYISFIPNQNFVSSIDNSIKYVNPSLAYFGVKVYSGNQYSKEYLGTVSCLFTDKDKGWTDGDREIVIIKTESGMAKIPLYKFQKYYWIDVKDNDLSKNVNKCN